jgi:hypothetical protein
MVFLQQNREQEGRTVSARRLGRRMAQIMYTHVSKCKDNKIKLKNTGWVLWRGLSKDLGTY